ncbi:hypothetical protein [Microbacterium karelineae]|uniref:hypothetical protein n=1 Tax=Microbacterium karelineae TaxID=2654283 RepID=UPI0012E9F87B|nr:hypothetical protein [Microbacterium karelineae]
MSTTPDFEAADSTADTDDSRLATADNEVALATVPTRHDSTNIIVDPDFRDPQAAWTLGSNATTVDTTGGPGRALKLEADGKWTPTYNVAAPPVKVGEEYLFQARVQNNIDKAVTMRFHWTDKDGVSLGYRACNVAAGTSWTDYAWGVTAPPDAVRVRISLRLGGSTTGNAWITKFRLLRRPTMKQLAPDVAARIDAATEGVMAVEHAVAGISPMNFGAAGNGTTDDTGALRRAINAAGTTPILIDREYRITGTLATAQGRQTFQGAGGRIIADAASTYPHWGEYAIFKNNHGNTTYRDIVTVGGEFVYIFGRGQLGSGSPKGPARGRIINCRAFRCSVFADLWHCDDVLVEGCYADVYRAGVIGHGGESNPESSNYIDPSSSTANARGIISNNIFKSKLPPSGFGTPDAEGAKSTGVFLTSCRDYVVSNNYVENARDVSIDFEGCLRCKASDNIAIDANYGCYTTFFSAIQCSFIGNLSVQTSSTTVEKYSSGPRASFIFTPSANGRTSTRLENLVIEGNEVYNNSGNSDMAIVEAALTDGSFRDNVICTIKNNKIHQGRIIMRGGVESTIQGNTVYNGAIETYGCGRIRIMDNTVRRHSALSAGIRVSATNNNGGAGSRPLIANNYVWIPDGGTGAAISVGGPSGRRVYATVANNYMSVSVHQSNGDTTVKVNGNTILN